MNLAENFRIAFRGLVANRLRSALTVLGLLIGVGAVIILISWGNGSQVAVANQIASLGTNTLTVSPGSGGFGRGGGGFGGGGFGGGGLGAGRTLNGTQSAQAELTATDVDALGDQTAAPDIASVSPVVTASDVTMTYDGATTGSSPPSFVGSTPSYEQAEDDSVDEGTFITQQEVDEHQRVVVLGQTVVTDLFGTGVDPIGKVVGAGRTSLTVVGVLTPKGSSGLTDEDDVAIAPVTTVQDQLTGYGSYSSIVLVSKTTAGLNAAEAEATSILDGTHHIASGATADFTISNASSFLSTQESAKKVLTTLLGVIGAISLLVGGIGVMNIMLVTVTERTREIGIRKAIGARRRDILGQFLVEAVMLSVIGGLIGVGAGLAGSRFNILSVQPVIAWYSVFLAFGVSVAVGLIFGIYPAWSAANMTPIDALRYE